MCEEQNLTTGSTGCLGSSSSAEQGGEGTSSGAQQAEGIHLTSQPSSTSSKQFSQPVALVIMGVAGTGKTTLAQALQARLGWPYAEADDFHPAANIAKMSAGHPLTDEDRKPWLKALEKWMEHKLDAGTSCLITCSALKKKYRSVLEAAGNVHFIELDLDEETLKQRMQQRNHFMPVSLLRSQLATLESLESDEPGIHLSSQHSVDTLVEKSVEYVSSLA